MARPKLLQNTYLGCPFLPHASKNKDRSFYLCIHTMNPIQVVNQALPDFTLEQYEGVRCVNQIKKERSLEGIRRVWFGLIRNRFTWCTVYTKPCDGSDTYVDRGNPVGAAGGVCNLNGNLRPYEHLWKPCRSLFITIFNYNPGSFDYMYSFGGFGWRFINPRSFGNRGNYIVNSVYNRLNNPAGYNDLPLTIQPNPNAPEGLTIVPP